MVQRSHDIKIYYIDEGIGKVREDQHSNLQSCHNIRNGKRVVSVKHPHKQAKTRSRSRSLWSYFPTPSTFVSSLFPIQVRLKTSFLCGSLF